MDSNKLTAYQELISCLEQPACLMRDGALLCCNPAAAPLEDAFRTAPAGELPRTVAAGGRRYTLTACPLDGCTLVTAEPEQQALSAAGRALRTPLASLFSIADSLLPYLEEQEDPKIQLETAELNRSLYRMFRTVGNLEAAAALPSMVAKTRLDLADLLSGLCARAAPLCGCAGVSLESRLPAGRLMAEADRQQLERAVLNLLSNAIQFADRGTPVVLSLSQAGKFALISVSNQGAPVDRSGELPADPRQGAGFGLSIVREIARLHGGTLLLQPQAQCFTAVFSVALGSGPADTLRSPRLAYDYAGGFDHLLLELADVLPSSVYQSVGIN